MLVWQFGPKEAVPIMAVAESFRYILDGLMLASGLAMLWNAFAS